MLKNTTVRPGFSLIELMISIGIIMLILGLVVKNGGKILGKATMLQTKNTLSVVNQAILEFKMDVHRIPNKLEDLDKRPEDAQGWNGSYLPENMQGKPIFDGWGNELEYKINPRGSKKAYELYSLGDPEKEENPIYAE